jgi:hypothetical protein
VLRREGLVVNRKRARRLMRLMGIEAIYQKPNTSLGHPAHEVYPYLLRGVLIDRPNQVWCADITYVPMAKGFVYLVAVMDWFSRRVLSWRCRSRWIRIAWRRCARPCSSTGGPRFSRRSRHDAPPFKLLKFHSSLSNICRYWGFGRRADTGQFQILA